MTNNEDWELKAIEAGRSSGDLLAPIVYCPELHFSEFASSVADMKNSVGVSINLYYVSFFFLLHSIALCQPIGIILMQCYLLNRRRQANIQSDEGEEKK